MSDARQYMRGLRSNEPATRRDAVERLNRLGEKARFAAVALVHVCGDENEEVRVAAGEVLESMGPPDPEDCAALAQLLFSTDADVVYWAATLLGRAQRDAVEYVVELEELMEEGNTPAPTLRRVAWALAKIGSDRALGCLKRAVEAPCGARHNAAQRAMRSVG